MHRWRASFSVTAASNTVGVLGWKSSPTTPLFTFRFAADRATLAAATKELPKTPDGANPYDVFEMNAQQVKDTSMEELAKQFKKQAIKHHPDREGGSHDKMAEINAAFKILKEWHPHVQKQMDTVKVEADATKQYYRQGRSAREAREETMGRAGGLRENVRAMNSKKRSSPAEIATKWEEFREDRATKAQRMCGRYEVACEQGIFFKRAGTLNELTARERWLRKEFIKGVWEDVHEMRTELLRRGARNAQMSKLAEEMVAFATKIQSKVDDDFKRQAQQMFNAQIRFHLQRFLSLLIFLGTAGVFIFKVFTGFYYNSMTLRYKEAFTGSSKAAA